MYVGCVYYHNKTNIQNAKVYDLQFQCLFTSRAGRDAYIVIVSTRLGQRRPRGQSPKPKPWPPTRVQLETIKPNNCFRLRLLNRPTPHSCVSGGKKGTKGQGKRCVRAKLTFLIPFFKPLTTFSALRHLRRSNYHSL